MGHPNDKVARSSHSVFSSFIASEKDSDQDDRILLKEHLVFYYMRRSLEVKKDAVNIIRLDQFGAVYRLDFF